jgi:8-oxo-dGTP pyrophosphatase MutT (NUDIX family)
LEQILNKLKLKLAEGLPGVEAQYLMAPVGRKKIDELASQTLTYRSSAVLVLLCINGPGEAFIPLIERMSYNGAHSGQVSLPGGKFEERDVNLETTALRECEEEVGIKEVELIGNLTELFIPVSQFKVQPFIGVYKLPNPTFTKQEREVKNLIPLMLEDLMNDTIIKNGEVNLPNNTRMNVPYFEVGEHKVWGATAMILHELKVLLV